MLTEEEREHHQAVERSIAEQHQQAVSFHQQSSASFTRTVILVAGGALSFSVTFWEKMVGSSETRCAIALHVGWSGLALSLASALVGMLFSLRLQDLVVNNYRDWAKGAFKLPRWQPAIGYCNDLAVAALLGGMMGLMVFASCNIGDKKMSEKKLITPARTDLGKIRKDSYSPTKPLIPEKMPTPKQQQVPAPAQPPAKPK